jgi:hypothetical protein
VQNINDVIWDLLCNQQWSWLKLIQDWGQDWHNETVAVVREKHRKDKSQPTARNRTTLE